MVRRMRFFGESANIVCFFSSSCYSSSFSSSWRARSQLSSWKRALARNICLASGRPSPGFLSAICIKPPAACAPRKSSLYVSRPQGRWSHAGIPRRNSVDVCPRSAPTDWTVIMVRSNYVNCTTRGLECVRLCRSSCILRGSNARITLSIGDCVRVCVCDWTFFNHADC